MSEYQYYEFQALDRPLSEAQMDELRGYSSRATITPTRFLNVYNWGSFKGNPDTWMEHYFDAFLYLANWGSRQLMFRLPRRLLDTGLATGYQTGTGFAFRVHGDHVILSFEGEEIDAGEWAEGEGWLTALLPIRDELLLGDTRCLYLGWLIDVAGELLEDDVLEPPVPPGLADLSAGLQAMAEFFSLDPDLIAAAAEASAAKPSADLSKEDLGGWLAGLPEEAKDALLLSLLEGNDPHVIHELRRRAIQDLARDAGPDTAGGGLRRSVAQLLARSQAIVQERKEREARRRAQENARRAREIAKKRQMHLAALAGQEGELWRKVDELIAAKKAREYGEAVAILQDLRDLADAAGQTEEFASRMRALYARYSSRPALIRRFREARLPE